MHMFVSQSTPCEWMLKLQLSEHAKQQDLIIDCLADKQFDKRNQVEVVIEHISYLYLQE